MKSGVFFWIGRTTAATVVALAMCSAWAVDPDVAFHIQTRKSEVTPHCAAALKRAGSLTTQQSLRKALCWLYGIGTPPREVEALNLLRSIAPDSAAAKMALADALQQGTTEQQKQAVEWYTNLAASGDVRAIARKARLQQRLDAQKAVEATTVVTDAADPFADPFSGDDSLPPGYHCHFYGLGKKVCHGIGFD